MEIRKTPAVSAALRTLAEDERRKVFAWFDQLGNWENDEHVRKMAKPTAAPGIYVLNTSDDIRIFFDLNEANREIVVVDLAKPSRFPVAGTASE